MGKIDMLAFLVVELCSRAWEKWHAQSAFKRAAPVLLVTGAGILSPTIKEVLVSKAFALSEPGGVMESSLESLISSWAGLGLVTSGVLFYIISYFCDNKKESELIYDKTISCAYPIGRSEVFCYSGSVTQVSGIDAVVTSEDTDLSLGGRTGTSVSGRIRKMAASYADDGSLVRDNLDEFIRAWKETNGRYAEFPLGTCVITDNPYEAKSYGVRSIIFAVAIRKTPSRIAAIDRAAIDKIVLFSINSCIERGYGSIFIPVFGLGSGNVSRKEAITATVNAVSRVLSEGGCNIRVYIGVYRFGDLVRLAWMLAKCA